jgi:uncharacterized oxidoreductase
LGGAGHYAQEVQSLVEFIRSCPTVAGVREILLPGDPERRTLAERRAHGIPLDDGNWSELAKLATKLGVPIPA